MTTPVIFRKWAKVGDIIALFPDIPADYAGLYCDSYMHVGQHGSANYDLILKSSVLATPEEYKELYDELVKVGYDDLKVCKRRTSKMYDEFMNEVYRLHNMVVD